MWVNIFKEPVHHDTTHIKINKYRMISGDKEEHELTYKSVKKDEFSLVFNKSSRVTTHKWTTDLKWKATEKVLQFWLWNIFMHFRSLNLNWLFLHRAVRAAYRITDNPSTSKPLLLSLYSLPGCGEWLTGQRKSFCLASWSSMTKGRNVVGKAVREKCCEVSPKNQWHNTTGKQQQ